MLKKKNLGQFVKKKPIPYPGPGVKKAPDLGSGSATLFRRLFYRRYVQGRVADPDPDLKKNLDPKSQRSQNLEALEAQNGAMKGRGRSH
jgi:hypothetical protein